MEHRNNVIKSKNAPNSNNNTSKLKEQLKQSTIPETLFNYVLFAKQILNEINFARTFPDEYIKKVKIWRSLLNDDDILVVGDNGKRFKIYVSKGEGLFDELIEYLSILRSCDALAMLGTLKNTAEDFMEVLQMHDGSDDIMLVKNVEDFMKRIKKYGVPCGLLGECVDYGNNHPEIVVLKLLLDAGDPTRTDRNIILNPKLRFAGISSGLLPSSERVVTILDFCQYFFDFSEIIPKHLLTSYSTETKDGNLKTERKSKRESSVDDYKLKEKGFLLNMNRLKTNQNSDDNILEINLNTRTNKTSGYQRKSLNNPNKHNRSTNLTIEQYKILNTSDKIFNQKLELNPIYAKLNVGRVSKSSALLSKSNSQISFNRFKFHQNSNPLKDVYNTLTKNSIEYSYVDNDQKDNSSNIKLYPPRSVNNNYCNDNENTYNRKFNLEKDDNIEYVNVNKKLISNKGTEKYLVRKIVYYIDGSIDEWTYKEDINN